MLGPNHIIHRIILTLVKDDNNLSQCAQYEEWYEFNLCLHHLFWLTLVQPEMTISSKWWHLISFLEKLPSLTFAFVVQYPPDESYLVDRFYNGESLCNLHLNQHGWLLCSYGRALKDKMPQYWKRVRTEELSDSLSQWERHYECNVFSHWLRQFGNFYWYDCTICHIYGMA